MTNLKAMESKPEGYFDSNRQDMLKYIPVNSERTLEFGCGSGGFSFLLKKQMNIETWAVELEEEAAKKASKKLDRVICADVHESLKQLPDDYFDVIIFFDILEHLADPYSLLVKVKSKLKKSGVITASIPNIRYYRAFSDYVFHGNWEYKDQGIMDKTHLRFFTRKSIVRMFESLDYEILTIEGIHPTGSRTYRLINLLTFGFFRDVRYKHYAIVAKPQWYYPI